MFYIYKNIVMSRTQYTMNFGADGTSKLAAMQTAGRKDRIEKRPLDIANFHPLRIEILARMLGEIDGTLFQDVSQLTFRQKDGYGYRISNASDTSRFTKLSVPGKDFSARVYRPTTMYKVMAPDWGVDSKNDHVVRCYHLLYSVISIHHNYSFEDVVMNVIRKDIITSLDSFLEVELKKRDTDTELFKDCPVPGRKGIFSTLYSIKDIEFLMDKTYQWYLDNIAIFAFVA